MSIFVKLYEFYRIMSFFLEDIDNFLDKASAHGRLKRVGVQRIEDRRHARADQAARDGIHLHEVDVGHLLDTNKNIQHASALLDVGADLAGVEDALGVKHLLDRLHEPERRLAGGLHQVLLLCVADGVFAGDLPAELGALGIAFVHDGLAAALELVELHVVGAAVDVQVAVARVAEAASALTLSNVFGKPISLLKFS